MVTIAYVGRENCSFMYFMIKAAKQLNNSVLVCDNSISGDLFDVLTNYYEDKIYENERNMVLRNLYPPQNAEREFDYCFIYNGLKKPNAPYSTQPAIVYVETSASKFEINRCADAYVKCGSLVSASPPTLIMVDVVTNKISVGLLSEELNIKFENGYMLPHSEAEVLKYQLLSRNFDARLKGVSKDFETMLKEQISIAFQIYDKPLAKLMKTL